MIVTRNHTQCLSDAEDLHQMFNYCNTIVKYNQNTKLHKDRSTVYYRRAIGVN